MSIDMLIIWYIYCMCLIIYWFLLSCALVYICLYLYVYVLYDCMLHDYPFSLWCIFGYYCSLVILACWLHRLIFLPTFAYWLFLLFDYLTFLDMYILIFVYLVHIGVIDSLYCILSYLSQHIVYSCYIPILLIIFLPGLCVNMSDIPVICMTTWCMIAILLCDACITCLCGTHIYPLSSNSLVSVDLVSIDFVFDMRLVTLFALRPS